MLNKRLIGAGAAGGAVVPTENFKIVTYTGTGAPHSITVGFQPDFVWIKDRSGTGSHSWTDSTRGDNLVLQSNENSAEASGQITLDSNGFTIGNNNALRNSSGVEYVAWCWKGGGGPTSNSDGSITGTVNANKAAGFSVVKYTGSGSSATVGHGLSSAPTLIIQKRISSASDWLAGASDWTKYLEPNGTPPFRTAAVWNGAPTSTTFGVINSTSTSSVDYITYCFADVEGYQKIATYTGNGSTNGPIVDVGFEPAFVLVKNLSSTEQWLIIDNTRNTVNPRNSLLQMNLNAAESTEAGAVMNFYSTGFQSVGTGGGGGSGQINSNGDTYLYWAIATDPDTEAPTLTNSFDMTTYTGNGNTKSITQIGFSPSLTWTKKRDGADDQAWFDYVRGANKEILSNSTAAEATKTGAISSFDANGFTTGANGALNASNDTYISWTWKANDDVPTVNENGSIDSIVSANANAGFSIVKWNGDGSASATVGHGLSSKPDMVIVKDLTDAGGWNVASVGIASNEGISLQSNGAAFTSMGNNGGITYGNLTATTFGFATGAVGVDSVNKNGNYYIAYCFHSVTGYQKFGSYSGSGSDSNAITVGFKPDFVMVKRTNDSGGWLVFDTKRSNGNPVNDRLEANNNQAEQTNSGDKHISITATTFEANGSDTELNASGSTYLYWAVAQNVTNNTTLASSFGAVFYAGSSDSDSSTTERTISGLGFKPDLLWIKRTDGSEAHFLQDNLRGSEYTVYSQSNAAEYFEVNGVQSFDSDGFTVAGYNGTNKYREAFVGYGWKAGNTWKSNIDGSGSSLVNANTANGFSIVKYIGTRPTVQTLGHGLNSAPEWILIKNVDTAGDDWEVYHSAVGATKNFVLNDTAAPATNSGFMNDTAPTSTVFTVGADAYTNRSGDNFIAYCWHSVSNYSKIGSYTGDGNAGKTITTGFKPDWILIKSTVGADNWRLYDNLRGVKEGGYLEPNRTDGNDTSNAPNLTITSTGFTITAGGVSTGNNVNGNLYTYVAFAKNATNNNTLADSFKVKTYTGNGTTQEFDDIGFKADLVWIKERDGTNPHNIWDTTRGAGKLLKVNASDAESGNAGDLLGYFTDDGFQINRNYDVHSAYDNTNYSGSSYVAWAWKAGNGWQSNLDGTVQSLTNANTANRFSVVRYVGNGSATTIGHGLGYAPTFMIVKTLESSAKWRVYHSVLGGTKALNLNDSYGQGVSANYWNDTAPTTSVFSVGADLSVNGESHIAYCWNDVTGYSKFGSYTGNGNSTGPSVDVGFKPDFVMIKRYDGVSNWNIYDSVRNSQPLYPNLSNAEGGSQAINYITSGFQPAYAGGDLNENGGNYVYMAFKMN